ncbi:hypothetical protein ACHAWF_007477 [Thalassiosira exigua]
MAIKRYYTGFSVGGQFPTALSYTLETKPKEHWGYYGGIFSVSSFVPLAHACLNCIIPVHNNSFHGNETPLTQVAGNGGVILGNLVGALARQFLTDEQLHSWGWRAAFFSGAAIIPVTFLLHLYAQEYNPNAGENNNAHEGEQTGDATSATTLPEKQPLREALKRENWPALWSCILCTTLFGGGYYLTIVWMAIYMDTLISPSIPGAFWINLVNNIVGISLATFFTSWLSDHYTRVHIMLFGAISVGIVGPFMVWIISWGEVVGALFAQMLIAILTSFYSGPFHAWIVEKFPVKIRLSSAGVGYNIGICLSSGFTPAVATALVQGIGPVAPGFIYPVSKHDI